jgi:hypothetical protein
MAAAAEWRLTASAAPFAQLPPTGRLFAAGFIVAAPIPRCPAAQPVEGAPEDGPEASGQRCIQTPDPYKRFLDTTATVPLSPWQKGHLALRNTLDPGNLVTIVDTAAFSIGLNSHTAYGPGMRGFGRNAALSLVQDSTGEFFGTFLIPSLTGEDPHYHRMPRASFGRRIFHAVSRTVLAEHDDGSLMLNYATLLTYPISAEISNLYVPGVRGDGPSTVARIMTGYASDPIDNLITEFLPDVARHIHLRVIFVQRLLNQVSSDQYSLP